MEALVFIIALLFAFKYAHCDITLTESAPQMKKPGDSVRLSCKITGFSLSSDSVHWVRQAPNKGLQWVGYFGGSSDDRFKVTEDSSNSIAYLDITDLQSSDTAVYYCARYGWGGYFDYWGKGTHVTVTQEEPRAPTSLFPLMACGSKGSDHLTLACIASDFSPASSVTFQWKNNGMAVTEFTQYPAVQINGKYTSISHVSVKAAERESYSCSMTHSSQCMNKEVTFQKPDQTPCLEVTLKPPKMRELYENNQAVLDCVITGEERAAVEGASVTWTPSGTSTSSEVTQHGHVFRKTSTLTLEQEHWSTNQKVECSVQQSNKPTIKKSFSNSASKVPEVVLITPIKQDSEFVTLVCVVTGFSSWDVFVMWKVDDGSYKEGITSEPVERDNGIFSVTSLFKVSTADWNSRSKVTCNVKHISMRKDAAPITKSMSIATGNSIECD